MYHVIGIFAHVDAGKTTFCEQILYHCQVIRSRGRVDHADAFLDDHPLERQRGITIFSSQASFPLGDDLCQIIDTPGHADFSGEMERALGVVDAAVLLVSCVEGIQAHTRTLWRMLERYRVPTLVFCNKTDREGANIDERIRELRDTFSSDIVDFRRWPCDDSFDEEVASRDDGLLGDFLDGRYDRERFLTALATQFRGRAIFPVLAGSALNDTGIGEVLSLLRELLRHAPVNDADRSPFSARVYKIRNDPQAGRLVYMRVLSGSIAPRDKLSRNGTEEKVTTVYRAQGGRLLSAERAEAGMLCAVTGLSCRAGEGIGQATAAQPLLEPILMASPEILDGTPPSKLLQCMRELEDEDPLLRVEWQEESRTISARVMGTVQLEVLERVLAERYRLCVRFGPCHVRYMETVAEECTGVGHYEPLRHYAEVRVLLIPAPRGSGVTFESRCHVDFLALPWQNMIREVILKKRHKGTLIGAELTDVRIVLINGAMHLKHTEGGDFYEAACRSVRNALMRGNSLLLEPVCRFAITSASGDMDALLRELLLIRAQTDEVTRSGAQCEIRGTAAASSLLPLFEMLPSLTHGRGAAQWEATGYEPCHNAAEVIAAAAYDAVADRVDPPDSVFCQKGAGFTVAWDHVEEWAHTAPSATY